MPGVRHQKYTGAQNSQNDSHLKIDQKDTIITDLRNNNSELNTKIQNFDKILTEA